jgi:isocitrate dehydrogenase
VNIPLYVAPVANGGGMQTSRRQASQTWLLLNGWLDTSKSVEKSLNSIINAEQMTLDLYLYLRLSYKSRTFIT